MERANPYADFGGTVTGTRFIGREAELRTIASRVFGAGGFGSIAVVGLPRIGKTSLVSEAIRRAEARADAGRADAGRMIVVRSNVGAADSIDGLFKGLLEGLVEGVRDRERGNYLLELEKLEKQVGEVLASPVVDFNGVRAVFKVLRRAEMRPVWVLDEFDAGRRVFENAPQCFHWLRELCSNPEFKAAVVLVAKRRLQDVARLAGHESDYWANVLMTLPVKPLSALDVASFFSRLDAEGVSLGGAERAEVLSLCGSHPYLLDAFGYYAWDHVEQGGRIGIEWIGIACGMLVRDYFQQIATVLDDGRMLSKAVQVIVGPQWDVTAEDAEALCELGVLLRDEDGVLRGFSRTFEDHLRVVERSVDIWPLWRDTERVLREALQRHLERAFGADWPDALGKARASCGKLIASCREKQARERKRFGARAESSLLAYTYPGELHQLMSADWKRLGEPLLGSDRQGWAVKFTVLAKVRTPLAHNREEAVSDGEREQARGICQEILELYDRFGNEPGNDGGGG